MNKYIIKALFVSALAAPALSSCELDQYPETYLPTEKSWQTVADAGNYHIGLQSYLRSVTGGSNAYITEVQSDLFNGRYGLAKLNRVYDWSFTNSAFDGDGLWTSNYSLIANANNIINNIGHIEREADSDDDALLKFYEGEAHFARAYAYSNLVVRYCKRYDAATAAETPGLPLVTTVDVNAKPNRSTLQQTYDFILDDIDKAKELMADPDVIDYTMPHYNTVRALEARVSLEMGNYENALTCARELIDKYPLCADEGEFAAMWSDDDASEIIYEPQQTQDEVTNSYMEIFINYSTSLNAYNPYFLPSQGLIDLYDESDMRLFTYFAEGPVATNDAVADGVFFNKFPGNRSLLKDPTSRTSFYNMSKAFRVAELYLIAAEAQNRIDGTGITYLNTLRSNRGAKEALAGTTGNALFEEIKKEWIREMVGEGFRLNCLKRWGDGFKRMQSQNLGEGFFLNATGQLDLVVEANNPKFVWEIPSNDLQANPNLTRNWQ